MKFAAFGRTQWLYDSIRAASAAGHQIVLIGTCAAAPESSIDEEDFLRLANEMACPYFCDAAINSPAYVEMAKASGAEVAISVNWLTLIGPDMLRGFKYGVVNAHAGDLPRFRGNACPNWAILTGEDKVVLSLHNMALDLDAGPILLQREFPLCSDTYITDVYRFMNENIPEMFVEVLDGLGSGKVVPRDQPSDPAVSLRCFPRRPEDGQLEWEQPAELLARLVRASAEPFAGAYSFLNGERIIVWRARAERLAYPYLGVPGQVVWRSPTGEVAVLTGDGILVLEEVETNSSGRSKAAGVIKSARERLGICVAEELANLRSHIKELKTQIDLLSESK